MKHKYYIAYGSNLNKAQMKRRCPGAVELGTSRIDGYKLAFRRGYLTIEPEEDTSVPVGVWMIDENDEKALDRYEGFPKFYFKQDFEIHIDGWDPGLNVMAMAYIMTDGHQIQEPSFAYLRTCSQGYKDFGIDTKPLMKAYRKSKGGER